MHADELANLLIETVCVKTHQEDDVGLLVQGSGHTDSLLLSTGQDDALRQRTGSRVKETLLKGFATKRNEQREYIHKCTWHHAPKGYRGGCGFTPYITGA